jgi:hypothetical protein
MRIIFVGNFTVNYSSENHHKQSLEALGHTVVPLQEGTASTKQIFKAAIGADALVWVHTHGWMTDQRYITTEKLFQNLKHIGIPTLTYHLDLWRGLAREKDLAEDPFYSHIEHFFTVDKLMADWFNDNTDVKGHFMPPGVLHTECVIREPQEVEYEVIFVGSKGYHPEWPYRPQLIDWLRETYGSKFLHVGGDGDTGTVRGLGLNQIYANAKVAVGDTLNIGFNYPYYTSDRLMESTGRGGFTIYPRIKGLDDLYEDGKEVVYYKHGDFDDLKEKIDYYLTHDEERQRIRLLGHKRAMIDHTYMHRWSSILEVING